jgi:predicted Zn-ribbon and HTH transcriptional regulator
MILENPIDLICPDCWFEFVHEDIEDIIKCPECGWEFYKEESVGD